MSAKHTPGPWHRNIKPARKYPTVWAGRNTHVAQVVAGAPPRSGSGETMSDEEIEANIDLIAAAPEMLLTGKHLAVKLAEIYRAAGADPSKCQAIRDWMAAAAKAEGRS